MPNTLEANKVVVAKPKRTRYDLMSLNILLVVALIQKWFKAKIFLTKIFFHYTF